MFLGFSEDSISLYDELSRFCPLGYGSGYGTALTVDKDSLARRLGFLEAYKNPIYGASFRGMDEVDISFFEVKLLLFISRLAQDLIIFSSDEFGFAILPDGFTTGSSLMPNKRNPDFLEMIQGYASESLGILTASISTVANKALGYHREFQLSKDKVMAFTTKLMDILDAFSTFFSQIEFDANKSRELVKNSTHATMEAFHLFSNGTSWKEAYRKVGSDLMAGKIIGEHQPDTSISVTTHSLAKVKEELEKRNSLRGAVKERLILDSKAYIGLK